MNSFKQKVEVKGWGDWSQREVKTVVLPDKCPHCHADLTLSNAVEAWFLEHRRYGARVQRDGTVKFGALAWPDVHTEGRDKVPASYECTQCREDVV